MSDFTHWTNPDLEIKFVVTEDLGTGTADYGFVKRQMAVSQGLYELVEFEDEANAIEELTLITLEGEEKAISSLEEFLQNSDEFSELERERFFPTVRFSVSFDNDLDVSVFVVVNERRAGSAEWLRFIALLLEEELESYQLERS